MKKRIFSILLAATLILTPSSPATVNAGTKTVKSNDELLKEYIKENAENTNDETIPNDSDAVREYYAEKYDTVQAGDMGTETEETEAEGSEAEETDYIPSTYHDDITEVASIYPNPVNQRSWGTCWACSATGLAEINAVEHGKSNKTKYSALQLAWYTYQLSKFPGIEGEGTQKLVDWSYLELGGFTVYASNALNSGIGFTTEERLPYSTALHSSTNSELSVLDTGEVVLDDSLASEGVVKLKDMILYDLKYDTIDDIKKGIMKYGAAQISYEHRDPTKDGTIPLFYGKAGDIYKTNTGEDCDEKYADRVTYSYDGAGEDLGWMVLHGQNHSVIICGWDDDFPKECFVNQPDDDGAWLCRNSWTGVAKNSINSYFWLPYEEKDFGNEVYCLDFEDASDLYDNNYQYDYSLTHNIIQSQAESATTAANVYKVSNDKNGELLNYVNVSFQNMINRYTNSDEDSLYKIKVYTNLTDTTDPTSGTLAFETEENAEFSGIYSVEIDEPLYLDYNSYYSVVVEGIGDTCLDTEFADDNGITKSITKSSNMSYYYNASRKKWITLTYDACIKAFTKNIDNLWSCTCTDKDNYDTITSTEEVDGETQTTNYNVCNVCKGVITDKEIEEYNEKLIAEEEAKAKAEAEAKAKAEEEAKAKAEAEAKAKAEEEAKNKSETNNSESTKNEYTSSTESQDSNSGKAEDVNLNDSKPDNDSQTTDKKNETDSSSSSNSITDTNNTEINNNSKDDYTETVNDNSSSSKNTDSSSSSSTTNKSVSKSATTVSDKVKTITASVFKKLSSKATVTIKSSKSIKIAKNTFKGINTKKMTIKCTKMNKKEFAKFKSKLRKAGFKGKIVK